MKTLLSLVTIAVCSLLVSCNSGGPSAATKKNLEVNDAITKAYQSGDFTKMSDYIAADAVDHGGENGDIKGLDSIVASMKRYHAMMPDAKMLMSRSLADDEYVFTWSKMSGTMGGKVLEMNSVDVAKFKDGKAVEHWVYMDPADMAKMMPPPPAMDSLEMKPGAIMNK